MATIFLLLHQHAFESIVILSKNIPLSFYAITPQL